MQSCLTRREGRKYRGGWVERSERQQKLRRKPVLLTIHEAWQTNRRTALSEREEKGLAIRWMDNESHLLHRQLIFFSSGLFSQGGKHSPRERPLQEIVLNIFLHCCS